MSSPETRDTAFTTPFLFACGNESLGRRRNKNNKRLEGGERVMGDERLGPSCRARSTTLRWYVSVFVCLQVSGSH